MLSLMLIAAACGAGDPSDRDRHGQNGDESGAAPAPGDRLAPAMLDDEPGREVAPAPFTPVPEAAEVTAESTIASLSSRAEAVAVVRIDGAAAFETADPPFVSTRYSLTALRVIAGEPPATVVVRGGALGDVTVASSEIPRLTVGGSYLAFFWPGPQLVFAGAMVDPAHARVHGKSLSLDVVPALVGQASGGGIP